MKDCIPAARSGGDSAVLQPAALSISIGALGLPELLVILFVLALVVGVGRFLLRSLASLVREGRKFEALERIAENAAMKTTSAKPEHES